MKETIQESSSTGSAKVHVQHTKNTHARTPREETGTSAGTARKDTTTVEEKNHNSGTQGRS